MSRERETWLIVGLCLVLFVIGLLTITPETTANPGGPFFRLAMWTQHALGIR